MTLCQRELSLIGGWQQQCVVNDINKLYLSPGQRDKENKFHWVVGKWIEVKETTKHLFVSWSRRQRNFLFKGVGPVLEIA